MIQFYKRYPLYFALAWIAGYVFLISLTDTLSAHLGIHNVVTLPVLVVVVMVLSAFIRKNRKSAYFGLTKSASMFSARDLYLAPLVLIASNNLWGGVAINFGAVETTVIMLTMLLIGIVEEILFRGFLFRAIARKNLKTAIIVSAVTFGMGHIVNLLTAASALETMLQIVYATAIGFLFTVFFVKTGSLIPCIVAHGVINALSVFAAPGNPVDHSIQASILTVLSLGYAIYLLKAIPATALAEEYNTSTDC